MFELILKDNTGKVYVCKSNNIVTMWYKMGKYIISKYQVNIKW
jgi:hypothetical protein